MAEDIRPPTSTSLPSPAQTTTTTDPNSERTPEDVERYRRVIYNTCFGLCIAVPVIALLPPRKLDLYTFGLGITWFTCAGFVVEQRTGQGMLWHIGNHLPSARNKERLEDLKRQETEAKERAEALKKAKENDRGLLKRVWMGGESDDWLEERKRKEREALEEGKGYGDLIWEQVKEVWGVTKKAEEGEEEEAASSKREEK